MHAFRSVLCLALVVAACQAPPQKIEGAGLKNSFEVSEAVVRGGQPTAEGMKTLEGMGVKTVINLRAEASDAEAVKGTSLKVVDIPLKTWKADPETIVAFLKEAKKAGAEGKCFIH